MIPQKLFEGRGNAERLELLENNMLRQTERTYQKDFTQEEVDEFKTIMSEDMIKLDAIEDELAEVKKEFKAKMEPLQKNIKGLLTFIKFKSRQVTEQVYLFDYQEEGMMASYNSDGDLVDTRRLTPAEKQTNIMSIIRKTGTEE
jgi:C1A family cysteine protease